MPWWGTILNTAIFLTATYFIVYGAIRQAHIRDQNLAEHRAAHLERFARMAVQSVEQAYPGNGSKKDLAIAAMTALYQDHRGLLLPSRRAMEIAVDAAMLQMPKSDGT